LSKILDNQALNGKINGNLLSERLLYYTELNDCLDIPILSEKISELASKQAKIKVTLFFKIHFSVFSISKFIFIFRRVKQILQKILENFFQLTIIQLNQSMSQ
jgi:hypothetical protein